MELIKPSFLVALILFNSSVVLGGKGGIKGGKKGGQGGGGGTGGGSGGSSCSQNCLRVFSQSFVFSPTVGSVATDEVKVVDENNVKVYGCTVLTEVTKPDGTTISVNANQGVDWAQVRFYVDVCGTYSVNVVGVNKVGYTFDSAGSNEVTATALAAC